MSDPINLIRLGMPTPLAVEVAAMIDTSTAPVTSVNGATGVVVLDADDVGAVASVNGNTGTVVLDANDVGAVAVPGSPAAYSTVAADLAAVLVAAGLMEPDE